MYFWVGVGCCVRFFYFIVYLCDKNGNFGEMFLKFKGSSNKFLNVIEIEVLY